MSTTGGFKKNVLSLYAVQGLQYLGSLLVLPILVRQLGSYEFGLLAFWQSLIGGLGIIIDYGFSYSAVRSLSKDDLSAENIGKIYFTTLSARLALLLPATMLLLLISRYLGSEHRDFTLQWLGLMMLFGIALSPAWYLAGMKKNTPLAYASTASLILVVILTWIFVRGPNALHIAAAIQFSAPLLTAACAHLMVARYARPCATKIKVADVIKALRDGAALFLISASSGLYSSLNPFLLGLVTASPQVAFFSMAERLVRGARGLLNPLMAAIFPYSASQDKSDTRDALLKRSSQFLLASSAILATSLFFCAPWIFRIFFGGEYETARIVTQILSINVVLVTISNLLGVQNLIAKGKDRHVTYITVVAVPIHVFAILLFGRMFGAVGAASAYLVTEAGVTLFIGFSAFKLRETA